MEIVKKDFRSFEPAELLPLWNGFYPNEFEISPEILRLNTIDCPLFDWGASVAAFKNDKPIAFVSIKRPATRLWRVPDPDVSHLSGIAFEDPETAVDLMSQVKAILKSRGVHRLIFGQDFRHFFPGCPSNATNLKSFLMVEGFVETGNAYDLERNLSNYENPAQETGKGEFRPLGDPDRTALHHFFEHNFPGRWRHDVLDKAAIEGLRNTVFGLVIDGKVEGFALVQDSSHSRPVGGAVWHKSLGENWGSLGPIGISKEIRGEGFGNELLGKALMHLKSKGVQKCIIDWTTLTDFYGKHGFQITRTYNTAHLSLGEKSN